jgi:hypothetical protein
MSGPPPFPAGKYFTAMDLFCQQIIAYAEKFFPLMLSHRNLDISNAMHEKGISD